VNATKGSVIDHNLYFDPHLSLQHGFGVTPVPCTSNCSVPGHPHEWTVAGSFASWVREGYDSNSKIDLDPMFKDPEQGDFGLQAGSPAFATGFLPLPPGADQC
jgi:hypothetical protein